MVIRRLIRKNDNFPDDELLDVKRACELNKKIMNMLKKELRRMNVAGSKLDADIEEKGITRL